MQGQWMGRYEGTNSGLLVLDLDDNGDFYEGCAYAFEDTAGLPSTLVSIVTEDKSTTIEGDFPTYAIDPTQPIFADLNSFPHFAFSDEVNVKLKLVKDRIEAEWSTAIGTVGRATLLKSEAGTPSLYTGEEGVSSWQEYRDFIQRECTDPRRYIFRGQSVPWRLRTSFHRTNRTDLFRLHTEDLPRLKKAIVAKTQINYNLNNPDEYGAFCHLVQHHGHPTPLLDWTYPPYVAAYFAFSSLTTWKSEDMPIRIFMFDNEQWTADHPQLVHMALCRPHFSTIEPLALGNDRAIPQQSLSALTNVDDIEAYIQFIENLKGTRYLRVFDIPASERATALQDLSLMGITAGSMFPGLDGICQEYRDRYFA